MEGIAGFLPLLLLVAVFYFLLIRPQKKRVEQHRRLIDSIELGDEVVTIGGVHGTVRRLAEDELELEISPGVNVRFSKSAIAQRRMADVEDEIGTTGEDQGQP